MAGAVVAKTPHFALHQLKPQLNPTASTGPSANAQGPFLLGPLFPQDSPPSGWLGAMVPKRWAKRAVTRNALKRQIYAVSAECGAKLPLSAWVVRLRATFDRQVFVSASSEQLKQAARAELQQLFSKVVQP
jgi:ribonuclease P protein component